MIQADIAAGPLPARETINQLIDAALAARPDAPFIDMAGEILTVAELDSRINAFAAGLQQAGVHHGETVCALADTSMDMVSLFFACGRIGAIWVPVNSALKGDLLLHQLNDSAARIMIVDARYTARVAAIAAGVTSLAMFYVRGEPGDLSGLAQPCHDIESLALAGRARIVEAVSPHDLCMIIYTSGTTGPSKGCMISHNYACAYGRELAWAMDLRADDILWFSLPLFHLGGLGGGVLGGLGAGSRIAIAPQFSVRGFWPEIERTGATVLIGVGPTVALLAEAPDSEAMARCFGQLRTVCAAPVTPAHQARWRERFGVRHIGAPGYGLTEASMVTLVRIAEEKPDGASGRIFDYFDLRIADDAGDACAPMVPGRILVRPRVRDVMFRGYWRRPEATLAAFEDLWFDTGDIGKIDTGGYFYFVDRAKDYLRRRGENISSFEVESAFRAHPAITDVAVHAVRSELGEDDLKATIVLKDGITLSEEAMCRWSIERLPYFAVPQFIEFRAELPRNPVGRVLKYQLRDEGVTAATWDRASCPDIVVAR